MDSHTVTFFLFGALFSAKIMACSCAAPDGAEEEQVRRAFEHAEFVFIGEVVDVEKIPHLDRFGTASGTGERARLKVTRVWKGSKSVGDEFLIETAVLGGGSCGASVINDPVWMDEANDSYVGPARFPGSWLIYAENEPYELSWCSRSHPYPFPRATADAQFLDELAQERGRAGLTVPADRARKRALRLNGSVSARHE